ncbi:MAG: hypothetical protein NVS3B12_28310 [Acidimicrobiales bacterium]
MATGLLMPQFFNRGTLKAKHSVNPRRAGDWGPLREEATADSMSLPQYGSMVALIHFEIRARCGFQMAARSAFSTERSLDRGLGGGDGRQADVTVLVHLAGGGEAPQWRAGDRRSPPEGLEPTNHGSD